MPNNNLKNELNDARQSSQSSRRNLLELLGPIVDGLGALTVLITLSFYLIDKLPALFQYLTGDQTAWLRSMLVTIIILPIGIGLHFFKHKWKRRYAQAEIAFALASGYAATQRIEAQGDTAAWVALGASVYLVARGMTNWEEAKEEKKKAVNIIP